MKSCGMHLALVACLFCAGVANGLSLDREAFSITKYDLSAQVEPDQHRLGVRGKITLRNDTAIAQKIAVLQISSSLDWRSIRAGDKALQYVTQVLTSDIDHTGALSEAIVTLPQAVEPHATIELEIGYEGVIVRDATRLTRIGTPDEAAANTDWDRIDASFTGLRGIGQVAWYPITTEVANLSEGDSLFEAVERWKNREAGATIHLNIKVSFLGDPEPRILVGGLECAPAMLERVGLPGLLAAECNPQALRPDAPTLVIAPYRMTERPASQVYFLPHHDAAASSFAKAAEEAAPLITDWFGPPRERAKFADMPDPDAAPFESGALLLTPLSNRVSSQAGLAAVHQLTHASFLSFRPWIEEGLAHFAQALYLEQQKGRQAALDYMGAHRSALDEAEPATATPRSQDEANRSLINTKNEELYRSKAMYVWWMLRDMVGDAALKKAIAAYRPEQDKEPSYMQRLISTQTQRDLEWFFDDWVYRDRGLPDFKVESAFARKTLGNSFMLTVTVDNLGTAGAEVPITIKFAGGEITKRLEVRAKDKATTRIETPGVPQEIRINDGSVPESDRTNNVFKVAAPAS
ncbi:MAG: hypothetical protein ACRD3B_19200 [Candidatus Sulfotelmatobacter sp.]